MNRMAVDLGDDLPLAIPRLLRERVERFGDAPLVVCDASTISYREAAHRSAQLARALLAVGMGKGTHVGVLLPNGPEFVVAWLAVTRIGAVMVPLSTFSRPAELTALIRNADIELLLSTRSYRSHDYERTLSSAIEGLDLAQDAPLWSPSIPTLRRVYIDSASNDVHPVRSMDGLLARAGDIEQATLDAMECDVSPADPMLIVHTSGSTSEPKGVVHNHGPLIRHLDNLNAIRGYGPGEILFCNSPWFWIGGFAYALLGTLVAGARLVCSNAPDAAGVLDVLERERPSMVNGFAASIAHLPQDPSFARRDLSSIRRGNLYPIMPEDVRPKDAGLRHAMLGMTEAGSVCLVSPNESELPEHQRGSFGRPAPGFEAKVVDPDTRRLCGVGEVGELCFRGPFLMEGYYGRERSEVFDADGWFPTGDLFHVDDSGLFYFHGRHGDMIKTAGANVSPREIEAVLVEAAGLRAHVVGLDDAERGQRVAAAIVSDAPVDLDALASLLGHRLSSYKVPKVFIVLSEEQVPMMSSGKLDVRALKERFDGR